MNLQFRRKMTVRVQPLTWPVFQTPFSPGKWGKSEGC